jgi:hypothetical protein
MFNPGRRSVLAHGHHSLCPGLLSFGLAALWNCRHLANPHLLGKFREFAGRHGLTLPEICTPEELMEYKTMKADPILEEVWRVKDKLSREMAADPAAYSMKLDEIANTEEKAGRKIIRSAAELQQLVAEKKRQQADVSAFALNDKPKA